MSSFLSGQTMNRSLHSKSMWSLSSAWNSSCLHSLALIVFVILCSSFPFPRYVICSYLYVILMYFCSSSRLFISKLSLSIAYMYFSYVSEYETGPFSVRLRWPLNIFIRLDSTLLNLFRFMEINSMIYIAKLIEHKPPGMDLRLVKSSL